MKNYTAKDYQNSMKMARHDNLRAPIHDFPEKQPALE